MSIKLGLIKQGDSWSIIDFPKMIDRMCTVVNVNKDPGLRRDDKDAKHLLNFAPVA